MTDNETKSIFDNFNANIDGCPLCGREKHISAVGLADDLKAIITCHDCGVFVSNGNFKKTLKTWNTRADRQAPQVDVDDKLSRDISELLELLETYAECRLEDIYNNHLDFCKRIRSYAQGHLSPKQDEWQPPEGYALVPIEPTEDMTDAAGVRLEKARNARKYKAMIAAAPTPTKQDGWQPIKTAPKDDTEVFVSDGNYTIPSIWKQPESYRDYGEEGGWCRAEYECGGMLYEGVNVMDNQPTHWMPLPTPPKTGEDE